MKILYISRRLNSPDGSSVHGREFAGALVRLGHEVVTFPRIERGGDERRTPQGTVRLRRPALALRAWHRLMNILSASSPRLYSRVRLLDRLVSSRIAAVSLHRILDDFEPDIVVFRSVLLDFTPNLIRKRVKAPMIVEINSIPDVEVRAVANRGASRQTLWAERKSYEPADAISVVSTVIKDHLRRVGEARPIVVAPNGVDLQQFRPCPENGEQLKRQHGLLDKFTLGYIGSFQKWHGLDDTLEVLRRLRAAGTPVHLVAIGDGSGKSLFEERVRHLGLSDDVTSIAAVPHDQVAAIAQMIDVAVMTYPRIEPFYFSPLKMFEYLACGIPVVASRLGQIREVLDAADIGVAVEPGDIDGFVRSITSLLENPDRRRIMGMQAREWAEANCTWEQNARLVLSAASQIAQ